MTIAMTLEQLSVLRLPAFRDGLEEQLRNPQYAELPFEDRITLLVEQEYLRRQENSLARRIRQANFPLRATVEEIEFGATRGLDRRMILSLAQCEWIGGNLNVLITGATGAGENVSGLCIGRCCLSPSIWSAIRAHFPSFAASLFSACRWGLGTRNISLGQCRPAYP